MSGRAREVMNIFALVSPWIFSSSEMRTSRSTWTSSRASRTMKTLSLSWMIVCKRTENSSSDGRVCLFLCSMLVLVQFVNALQIVRRLLIPSDQLLYYRGQYIHGLLLVL